MAFTVVYDACVLYSAPLRDLLIRLAMTPIVRAKWTDDILDEAFRNIVANRPDLDPARLARAAARTWRSSASGRFRLGMRSSYPSMRASRTESFISPRAIRAGAQAIVTRNMKDFPATQLEPFGLEAVEPDVFVLGLLDLSPGAVLRVLQEQAGALRSPPTTLEELLELLGTHGLRRSMAEARRLFGEAG